MNFSKPASFWKDFIENYWEKKPTVFKNFFEAPIATPAEVFDALVVSADAQRKVLPHEQSNLLFLENMMLSSDIGKNLPKREDGSLEGYAKRIHDTFKGMTFCLQSEETQNASYELFRRARQFARGFREHIGLPVEKLNLDVFMGNYSNTPFGIHKDTTSNFHFVVTGTKRFLLWPYEELEHMLDPSLGDLRATNFGLGRREPGELRKTAIVIEGKPGDVLYFPSPHWHVAEGTGELTTSFACAFYMHSSPMYHLAPAMNGAIRKKTPKRGIGLYTFSRETPAKLPDEMAETVKQIQDFAKHGAERLAREEWLKYQSASGFSPLEVPPEEAPLRDDLVLKRDPEVDFVWSSEDAEGILWAANGAVGRLPKAQGAEELLQRLASAKSFKVADELGRGGAPEAVHRELLAQLFRNRTLIAA